MHIILYRTKLCPRCFLAKKYLLELTRDRPEIHIEEREAFLSVPQLRQEGISMIPAIKIGDQLLSGIFLNRVQIKAFLRSAGCL